MSREIRVGWLDTGMTLKQLARIETFAYGGQYLGGFESVPDSVKTARLTVTDHNIFVAFERLMKKPVFYRIPWAHVRAIEAHGSLDGNQRITASRMRMFGAYALAVPKTEHSTFITVELVDDTMFGIQTNAQLLKVESDFRRIPRHLLNPDKTVRGSTPAQLESDRREPPAGPSLAQELKELAGLLEAGVLTESEFAAAKQRLLS